MSRPDQCARSIVKGLARPNMNNVQRACMGAARGLRVCGVREGSRLLSQVFSLVKMRASRRFPPERSTTCCPGNKTGAAHKKVTVSDSFLACLVTV